MSGDGRGGPVAWRTRRRWWLVVVVLLTGCSLVPTFPGGAPDVSELTPVAALQVHGRYLDGDLEVLGAAWRIVLQRTDRGAAEDGRAAGSVTARLVDGAGGVIAERHVVPTGSPEGDAARDVEEVGAFGLLLSTDRPADAVVLQVEADGRLYEEHLGDPVRVRLGGVPRSLTEALDVAITTDTPHAAVAAEVHGNHVNGRSIDVHGDTLHLDPTRYGPGPAHVVVLVTRGLAADIDHATTHIEVDFDEYLEITVDQAVPIEVGPGERYLILGVQVRRYVAPGETRTDRDGSWTFSFASDVDGSLDLHNASDGYPELYIDTAVLTPGDHRLTVRATDGQQSGTRDIPVRIAAAGAGEGTPDSRASTGRHLDVDRR